MPVMSCEIALFVMPASSCVIALPVMSSWLPVMPPARLFVPLFASSWVGGVGLFAVSRLRRPGPPGPLGRPEPAGLQPPPRPPTAQKCSVGLAPRRSSPRG